MVSSLAGWNNFMLHGLLNLTISEGIQQDIYVTEQQIRNLEDERDAQT
jgi:hypothetical protein